MTLCRPVIHGRFCSAATDILHENSLIRRFHELCRQATSRFNAYQTYRLYTNNSKKAILRPYFFHLLHFVHRFGAMFPRICGKLCGLCGCLCGKTHFPKYFAIVRLFFPFCGAFADLQAAIRHLSPLRTAFRHAHPLRSTLCRSSPILLITARLPRHRRAVALYNIRKETDRFLSFFVSFATHVPSPRPI